MGKHHNTTMAFTRTAWNTAHTVNVHTTVGLPQRQTKTETDDAVGGRKGWRTKTEEDEDGDIRRRIKTNALWGGAKWQLSFSWRLLQSDEDGTWYLMRLADSRAHGGCSSLCRPRSSRRTIPVASFLNLLSVKRIAKERRQSPHVVPTGLTED